MTAIPILDRPIARLMELDQASVFAIADIAEERLRQIEKEGWTTKHDDEHERGQLERAASTYAYAASLKTRSERHGILVDPKSDVIERMWPWAWKWWKPSSPHRDSVRAGALVVAALARHLRSAPDTGY